MKKTILEMPNVKWYIRQQELKKKKYWGKIRVKTTQS